jgi:two-component system, chemotaxis family, chemotaxis protein CheY
VKVLVIDDSRTVRMVISNLLREVGCEILEAGDGLEALERLEAVGHVDLMLADWNMPRMTGLEFVRAVRKLPVHNATKIVMVTTESYAEAVKAALAAGANGFIAKPFRRDTMIARLAEFGIVFPRPGTP